MNTRSPNILSLDPWSASSLVQKGIRRGDATTAQVAAEMLFRYRGPAVWKRLLVIAAEDVGIGSLDVVMQVACAAARHKADQQSLAAVFDAVRLLADSPKNREAEHLITIAAQHPDLKMLRERLRNASTTDRIAIALDPTQQLTSRAVATWFSSGLNSYGERVCGRPDLPSLMAGFSEAGLPDELTSTLLPAARSVREPMIVMLPLLFLAVLGAKEVLGLRQAEVPHSPVCQGIPLYAFDKHTATGKAALALFLRQNSDVRECLLEHAPEFRIRNLVEIAAFYVEGNAVSLEASWKGSHALKAKGIESALMWQGCSPSGVRPTLDVVRANLDHLNDIRHKLLSARFVNRQLALPLEMQS